MPDVLVGGVLEVPGEMLDYFQLLDLLRILLAFFYHQAQHVQDHYHSLGVTVIQVQ